MTIVTIVKFNVGMKDGVILVASTAIEELITLVVSSAINVTSLMKCLL